MQNIIKKIKNIRLLKIRISYLAFTFMSVVVILGFFLTPLASFVSASQNTGVSNSNVQLGFKLENPLGGNSGDIKSLAEKFLKLIFVVGTPLVAVVIIYSGYLYVSSMGDPNKVKHAKEMLLNALIGGALLLGSFVIAELISGTVDQIK